MQTKTAKGRGTSRPVTPGDLRRTGWPRFPSAQQAAPAGGPPFQFGDLPVQTKLTVSQPGDAFEQEADRVADQVMRTAAPGVVTTERGALPDDHVQRACCGGCASGGACDGQQRAHSSGLAKGALGGPCASTTAVDGPSADEEDSPAVQAKAEPGGLQARPALEQAVSASAGAGAPLAPGARSFMESRFGHDFGSVRVHADARAASLAQSINARAFTTGADVYFARGQYEPESREGRRLLAHELTHVVQQRASAVGRVMRYSLSNFSPADAARMDTSIPAAEAYVSGCSTLKPKLQEKILEKIRGSSYKFDAGEKNCGVAYSGVFGIGQHISIGPNAFDLEKCCYLGSTIAHEAGHLAGLDEKGARALECSCAECCPGPAA